MERCDTVLSEIAGLNHDPAEMPSYLKVCSALSALCIQCTWLMKVKLGDTRECLRHMLILAIHAFHD